MKSFFTINLGCKVNLFETNAIISQLVKRGFIHVYDIDKANIVLINTCSVTNKADTKSRNMINRAVTAKLHPVVVVMGCFSQVNKDWFANRYIDIVVGCNNKNKIASFLENFLSKKKQIFKINKSLQSFEEFGCFKSQDNTRAFLKIQDGCDFFCSYCLIPYCRGRQRSMKHEHVIRDIKWYVKNGYKEIVLTGVNTAGYKDDKYVFFNLLSDINKIPGDFRVRISSLEPFQIDKKIIDLFSKNPQRWANQIHLCLQSACNSILKAMNRKYTVDDFIDICRYIKKKMPNVAITTDYIVAFGNENEKQFNDAIKNLNKIRFADMNIFIYSRRKNTAADKLYKQDINPIVARKRYNKVVKLKNKFRKEYLRTLINKELKVLVEKPTGSLMHGYSSEFVKVYFKSGKNLRGQIVNVKPEKIIEDRTGPCLLGKRI